MTMTAPVVAIAWENWRLTRAEAAQRLSFGLVVGSAVLALTNTGATFAFLVLLSQHAMFWFSIAKLNGGRFLDGYRPGFPFHLLYSRPVPTAVSVGVTMAYDAIACTSLYLVSAALLGFAFGQALPLFSVVVWLVTFHLVSTGVQWATRNRVVQYLGSFGICMPFVFLILSRAGVLLTPHEDWSSLHVEFSLAENALMAAIGLVSFGLTVAGVARQRHGDAPAAKPPAAASGGFSDWLSDRFRFPCPTSSATRAQMWFDLKSSGLPVLAIGGSLAILILLLSAVSSPIDDLLRAAGFYTRPYVQIFVTGVAMFSMPIVLALGGNAFSIRRTQGRIFPSVFQATQAHGTAQLAGLKVLVRTVCMLCALVAVGASIWASVSFTAVGHDLMDGKTAEAPAPRLLRIIGELTGAEQLSLAVIISIGVALMVALRAARAALRARYPRQTVVAESLLLVYGLAFVLRAPGPWQGLDIVLEAILNATPWVITAAIVLASVYLLWRTLAERILTLPHIGGALLASAAFAAAWLTLTGIQLSGMAVTNILWTLSLVLLPLTVSLLAPWSLNRIRHM